MPLDVKLQFILFGTVFAVALWLVYLESRS